MLLRLVTCLVCIRWALYCYKVDRDLMTWVFAGVAVLVNPLFPIHLRRAEWQPIDVAIGCFLGLWCIREVILERPIKENTNYNERSASGSSEEIGECVELPSDPLQTTIQPDDVDKLDNVPSTAVVVPSKKPTGETSERFTHLRLRQLIDRAAQIDQELNSIQTQRERVQLICELKDLNDKIKTLQGTIKEKNMALPTSEEYLMKLLGF